MSAFQVVQLTVEQAARRRRWQRAWRGFWQGLLAGAVAWLAALGVYKVLPTPELVLLVAGGLAPLLAAVGFLLGWRRSEAALTTALWLDQQEHLRARLSTALELGQDPRGGEWRELLVNDAATHAGKVDVRRLLPFHLPDATRWALLALLLGAGLGFVPEYRSKEFLQKQRDKEVIREAGKHLADLTRRSLERRKPALEGTQQNLKAVGDLGTQLARNPVTRPEALRELAKVTDKVQQENKELAKNPALKAMERNTASAGKNAPASAEELQKQMESMQKALGGKEPHADALDKLQQELQKARQAAAGMLGRNSPGDAKARENLAKALANLAKQSQDLGAALPSLEEAIAALEAGRIDQVLKDLRVAERDLEKAREMAQSLQQMQQQAVKLGKDLAEQLRNGQAEAAHATLKKMVNLLKAGDLSSEQLKKLLAEVSAATKEAAPYGKVADHLKDAAKQLERGQKPEGAQALADAAKELEKLMEAMADAQDLKASLDALKRAQLSIGNCTGWGQSQTAGAGKGGKPGKGVGTWADESGWIDQPEDTSGWDNSGIERPDTAARGHSDRGEGQLPEGLTPTQVKGRLNPGGPMPSITLKGVSIKGQSTVAVQEAVTAAQSEAQSALSHEQVPRAYQGAVKDYFDDLKK